MPPRSGSSSSPSGGAQLRPRPGRRTGFWALLAVGLVETGGRLRRLDLSVVGLGLIAYTAVKTVGYDHDRLDPDLWPVAFLLAGAGALLGGFEYQRLGRDRWQALRVESAGAVVASALLGIFALVELADGAWSGVGGLGGTLVLLALPYALLAAAVFRTPGLRDLATLLWGLGLAILAAALFLLLAGGWLVLALTAGAAALAGSLLPAREPRLQIASAAYLVTALAYTLVVEAPPADFFVASAHPGDGAQSLVLVALAAIALGLATALAGGPHGRLRRRRRPPPLRALPGDPGAGRARPRAPACRRTSSAATRRQRRLGRNRALPADAGPRPPLARDPPRRLRPLRDRDRQALPLRPDVLEPDGPPALLPGGGDPALASGFFYQRLSERMAARDTKPAPLAGAPATRLGAIVKTWTTFAPFWMPPRRSSGRLRLSRGARSSSPSPSTSSGCSCACAPGRTSSRPRTRRRRCATGAPFGAYMAGRRRERGVAPRAAATW